MFKLRVMGIGLILLLAAVLAAGCLTDPEKKETPTEEPPEFKDLTSKEDVIYNLVLSYAEKNITEFSKLLLDDGDTYNGSTYPVSYYWYNQPGSGLDEYWNRDDDIAITNNIFMAAKGTPTEPLHPEIDRLILTISDGSWSQVTELFGQTCEDCWLTEREYEIRLEYGDNAILGADNIQLYIVPVDEGGITIYKIAIAKDVRSE